MSKKTVSINVALVVASAGVGFLIGHNLAKRKYTLLADEEIASVKESYSVLRKEGVFATPESAVDALIPQSEDVEIVNETLSRNDFSRMLIDNGYAPLNGEDPDDAEDMVVLKRGLKELDEEEYDGLDHVDHVVITNLWDSVSALTDPEETTDEERNGDLPDRTPDKPYIIAVEEFMEAEVMDDDKISLLYFEGDDTLVDERESLIPDIEGNVGEANMHMFGLGSQDRNAVYIFNERQGTYYEVIRDTRSYAEVILGIKPERADESPRKMRENDQ